MLIGAASGEHAAPLWPALAPKAADIYAFQGPTLADTKAVIALAEQCELNNPIEFYNFDALSIDGAYQKLAKGELTGRAVIRVHEEY